MTTAPRRSTGRRLALWGLGALMAAGVVVGGIGAVQLLNPPAQAAQTGAERRQVDPVVQSELPPAAPVTALEIPAIGFASTSLPYALSGESIIRPPTADAVYWLSDFGSPGAGTDNTVYLVGHTSADGRAVFDPLIDRAGQRSTVLPGDELVVTTETGRVVYEVVAAERHSTSALADFEDVWSSVPGRVVIITCFFEAETDTVADNYVLFARQATPSSS